MRCWTLPRQRKRPLTMMAILVHSASHSSMLQKGTEGGVRHRGEPLGPPPMGPASSHLWDVSTTDLPSLTRLRMQSHRNRRAPGSIPVVGSSCKVLSAPGRARSCPTATRPPPHCPH